VYLCPVPTVSVPVPGYRRVDGYGFEKGRSVFFWEKPVVSVPVYPPPAYPCPCTCRPCPYPRTRRYNGLLKRYNGLLKRYNDLVNHYNVWPADPCARVPPYPYPWYLCTRDGHGYEMGRVRFWKKNRLHVPAVPV
jgi:hypothetical protein